MYVVSDTKEESYRLFWDFCKGIKNTGRGMLVKKVVPGVKMTNRHSWIRVEMADETLVIFTNSSHTNWRIPDGYYLKAIIPSEQFELDAWPVL